jgi:hypothetical protein
MLLVDPDDPKARVLTWSKMSVARAPASLRWRWEGDESAEGPPKIRWEGTCDLSADEILGRQDRALRGAGGDGAATAVDNAAQWLMEQFEGSESIAASEVRRRAEDAQLSWRTVERAKARLKIKPQRESIAGGNGAGRWMWRAATRDASDAEFDGAPEEMGQGSNAAKQTTLADLPAKPAKARSKSARKASLRKAAKAAKAARGAVPVRPWRPWVVRAVRPPIGSRRVPRMPENRDADRQGGQHGSRRHVALATDRRTHERTVARRFHQGFPWLIRPQRYRWRLVPDTVPLFRWGGSLQIPWSRHDRVPPTSDSETSASWSRLSGTYSAGRADRIGSSRTRRGPSYP